MKFKQTDIINPWNAELYRYVKWIGLAGDKIDITFKSGAHKTMFFLKYGEHMNHD